MPFVSCNDEVNGRYNDEAMVNLLKESGAKRPPGTAPRRASVLAGGGDSGGWSLEGEVERSATGGSWSHFVKGTLPKTNIAIENPPF